VDDPNVKVIEVVLDHLAYGWNAETIQETHSHLSLAQVYAALAQCLTRGGAGFRLAASTANCV
jgi:uncharacterized protein (DUF433 family)